MKKTIFGLGVLALASAPLSIGLYFGLNRSESHQQSKLEAQKDVDFVFNNFVNANLLLNPQQAVKAANGDFNAKTLENIGYYDGFYPTTPIPEGVSLSYQVNDIAMGSIGNLSVIVSKKKELNQELLTF